MHQSARPFFFTLTKENAIAAPANNPDHVQVDANGKRRIKPRRKRGKLRFAERSDSSSFAIALGKARHAKANRRTD